MKDPPRYILEKVSHQWQVIDTEQSIWIVSFDSRYILDAEKRCREIINYLDKLGSNIPKYK